MRDVRRASLVAATAEGLIASPLKLAGAFYLVWLGMRTFRTAPWPGGLPMADLTEHRRRTRIGWGIAFLRACPPGRDPF